MDISALTTPVKSISWAALILPIQISEEGWENDKSKDFGKPFPFEKRSSVRPIISGKIKDKYPDRIYKTSEEVYEGDDERYQEFKGKLSIVVRRIK